jgi:hypothetical protein
MLYTWRPHTKRHGRGLCGDLETASDSDVIHRGGSCLLPIKMLDNFPGKTEEDRKTLVGIHTVPEFSRTENKLNTNVNSYRYTGPIFDPILNLFT